MSNTKHTRSSAVRTGRGQDELDPGPEANGSQNGQDVTIGGVQATVEGVAQTAETVELLGKRFRMADDIGLMPLLSFAHAAKLGLDSDDLDGMAAMYAMIRDCIDPADWPAFERHAIDEKADGDDLFAVVGEVLSKVTSRPTRRRSGSSQKGSRRSARSRALSSSPDGQPARVPPGTDKLIDLGAV